MNRKQYKNLKIGDKVKYKNDLYRVITEVETDGFENGLLIENRLKVIRHVHNHQIETVDRYILKNNKWVKTTLTDEDLEKKYIDFLGLYEDDQLVGVGYYTSKSI